MPKEFIVFVLLGFSFGILYDVFRFLRFVLASVKTQFFIDFLYFVVISVIYFIFLLAYNNGEVRVYYFTLSLVGFLLYTATLFRITEHGEKFVAIHLRNLARKVAKSFKKVLQFVRGVYYNSNMLRRKPLRKKKKVGNTDESIFSENKTE